MVGEANRLHCRLSCGAAPWPSGSGSLSTNTRFRNSGELVMPHVSVRATCMKHKGLGGRKC